MTQIAPKPENLAKLVYLIRGEKVLLDTDLADLYSVEARAVNQAVARNRSRFPDDFMFQLTTEEWAAMRSQVGATSATHTPNSSQVVMSSRKNRGIAYRPYAFTEQGVAMLSSVLRSQRAVEVNIAIPSAARMRQALCGGVADSLMQAAKGAVLGEGTVIGRVTSNAEAVEEALVIANWYIDNAGRPSATPSTVMARRATRSSAGGRYVACALPENVPVTLHAERAEAKSAAVTVTAAPNTLAEAFLTLAPAPVPAKKAARP